VDRLTSLAVQAQQGDRGALEAFVRGGQADVWRCCAGLVGSAHADDLTQDTFARALRSLPQFAARASARTWLLSIARHACADWVRAQQRARRLRGRLEAQPRDDSTPADHSSELDALVSALAPERREAFVVTQLVGLSYQEAAEVCGCPIGTIRSRVARARLDLLDMLGNQTAEAADS
jgi:RNA polymerase sigma-70 factor (ECF subfamily)